MIDKGIAPRGRGSYTSTSTYSLLQHLGAWLASSWVSCGSQIQTVRSVTREAATVGFGR